MIALAFLLVFAAFLAISIGAGYLALRMGRGLGWKPIASWAVAVVAAIATPAALNADHLIGEYHFNKLCAAEAGEHIYRSVPNVEGFLDRVAGGPRTGYTFSEEERNGKILRHTIGGDRMRTEQVVELKSAYVYERSDTKLPYHMLRSDDVIRELKGSDVLARRTAIVYEGGWLVRTLQEGMAVYASCGGFSGIDDMRAFFNKTLIPSPQQN